MYYRLDKIKVENIGGRKEERFNILSEVVDSGISFESPVIVDSVRDLELWFGKSFKEYDYLCGLLEAGVSLYLYKPIRSPKESFISRFKEVREFEVVFPLMTLPEKGEKGVKYIIGVVNKKSYLWTGIRWMEINPWSTNPKDWQLVEYSDNGNEIYQRKITDKKIDTIEITRVEEYTYTSEKLVSLFQAESTRKESRIGKIYVLPDGTRYLWYEWIRLEDLRLLPDFDESEYSRKAIEVVSLPEITDKNREELEKNIYRLSGIGDVILYGDSTWMDADYFPQTIENTSESLNNRDTLLITKASSTGPKYTYPKFDEKTKCLTSSITLTGGDINYPFEITEEVVSGKVSYAFQIEFPEELSEGYIVLPNTSNEMVLLYKGADLSKFREEVPESYAPTAKSFYTEKAFFKLLEEELGYKKIGEQLYLSQKPLLAIDFCTIPGLRVFPDINTTLEYINSLVDVDDPDNIEVWSTCIGKDSDPYDDAQQITFTIEEGTLPGYYRVVVRKYGYDEVFEAPIFTQSGEDCLEYKINNGSSLIRCRLKSKSVRTGTYVLRGGVDESSEYTPEMYRAGLDELFDMRGAQLYTDFLLVPEISKYGLELGENLTYDIYDKLLKIAKENRLQVLIQNELIRTTIKEVEELPDTRLNEDVCKFEDKYYKFVEDYWEEIINPIELQPMLGGGNFVFNLLDDENRLVYFLTTIQTPGGKEFPGYSLFLNDFLSGIFNDFVSENIIYPRVAIDPYTTGEFEKNLIKYKSNYLTINNHRYYYKNYLSGDNYRFTILRQFILGKIYRELMKFSRTLITKRKRSEIENLVKKELDTLTASYPSIISNLKIVECDLNLQQNKLTLKIESSLKELVEEDILLDITINYNENGNSIAIS